MRRVVPAVRLGALAQLVEEAVQGGVSALGIGSVGPLTRYTTVEGAKAAAVKIPGAWQAMRAASTATATEPLVEHIANTFGMHMVDEIKPWLPQYAAKLEGKDKHELDDVVRNHMLHTGKVLDDLAATLMTKAQVIADAPMDAGAREMLKSQLTAFPIEDLQMFAAIPQRVPLTDWQDLVETVMAHIKGEPVDAFKRKAVELKLRGKMNFFLKGAAPEMETLLNSQVEALPVSAVDLLLNRWDRVGDAEMRRVLDSILKHGVLIPPEGAETAPLPYAKARALQALDDLYPDAPAALKRRMLSAMDKMPSDTLARHAARFPRYGAEQWRRFLALTLSSDPTADVNSLSLPDELSPAPLGITNATEAAQLANHLIEQLSVSAGSDIAVRTAPFIQEAVSGLPSKKAHSLRVLAAEGLDHSMPAEEVHDLVAAVLSTHTPASSMDTDLLGRAVDATVAKLADIGDEAYMEALKEELPRAIAARSAFEVRSFLAWLPSASAEEAKESVSELVAWRSSALDGLEDAVIRSAADEAMSVPGEEDDEAARAASADTAPAPVTIDDLFMSTHTVYEDPGLSNDEMQYIQGTVLERYSILADAKPDVLAKLERMFAEYPPSVLFTEIVNLNKSLPPLAIEGEQSEGEPEGALSMEARDAVLRERLEYFAAQPVREFVDSLSESDRLGWIASKLSLEVVIAAAEDPKQFDTTADVTDLETVHKIVTQKMSAFGADMFRRDVLCQLDEEPASHACALFQCLLGSHSPPTVEDMHKLVDWKVDTLPVDYDLLRTNPEEVFAQLEELLEEEDPMPPLEEIYAKHVATEEAEREARRLRELAKEVEQARMYVRNRDRYGRSYATGKRKTSVARVWLERGSGDVTVNGMALDRFFSDNNDLRMVMVPFETTSTMCDFNVQASIHGGGNKAQAHALQHGIAKALQAYDPILRAPLRQLGLITRDPRMVERKKPGRRGARRAFQWVKR